MLCQKSCLFIYVLFYCYACILYVEEKSPIKSLDLFLGQRNIYMILGEPNLFVWVYCCTAVALLWQSLNREILQEQM